MIGALVPVVLMLAAADPVASTPATPKPQPTGLPPVECVSQLRDARIALQQGERQVALATLRAAVEAFPDELIPIFELWNYHQTYELPAEEATALRGLLANRLASAEAAVPPGTLKYLVDSPEAAEEELKLIYQAVQVRLDRDPQNVELLEAKASLELRMGRTEDARTTLGHWLELEPNDGLRWRCIELDQQLERWAAAATLLGPLVEREFPPPQAQIQYILTLGKLGRYDELIAELERSEKGQRIVKQTIREILLEAAWDFRDLGQDERSAELLRKIVADDPEDQEALAALTYLYSTPGERAERERQLAQVWDEEKDPFQLLAEGGNLLAAGESAAAVDLLRRAAESLPDSEIAWFNLGVAQYRLERWELASAALARAAAINPNRVDTFITLGSALRKQQRCEEAMPHLQRALELQPDRKEVYFHLYVCHEALGNKDAALEAYRRYNQ